MYKRAVAESDSPFIRLLYRFYTVWEGEYMRLDKYLKVSRIIKRRTVANEACDAGRVMVNGKVAKASADVKVGDRIDIEFGNKSVAVEVTQIADSTKKEDAKDMFKYL